MNALENSPNIIIDAIVPNLEIWPKGIADRGQSMKKLLLTEGLIACFFLALFLGLFGKFLSRGQGEWDRGTGKSGQQGSDGLTVYSGVLQEKFSPLDYQTKGEENVFAMCFSNLLSRDSDGRRNNKPADAAWGSEDKQFAHISVSEDAWKDISVVTIRLNHEAETPLGKKVDAKDLLFNIYLRCSITANDTAPFGGVRILGQEEYVYGTKDIEGRKKELQGMLKNPSDELKQLLREEIVEQELQQEWEWVKGLYEDASYDFISEKYTEAKDLFAYYYSYQTKYSSKNRTEQQVFSDILEQYDWDYTRLSKVTNENYTEKASRLALSVLLKEQGNDTVPQISGVCKKDDMTVEVQIAGGKENADKFCDMWLLPLEEYGDGSLFDGVTRFGFRKGEAEAVLEKSYQKFSGTGAFYSVSMGKKHIVLRRNPGCFVKRAEVEKVYVLRREYEKPQEMVEDMLQGEADIIMAQDSAELDKLLASNGTGASYSIRKVMIETSQLENCFLYRTSYVNAPSLPKELTEYKTLFQNIGQVKINE